MSKLFKIGTINNISRVGLNRFDRSRYVIHALDSSDGEEYIEDPMALMLRSHKLQVDQVARSVTAIARCGAGTNNIPVAEMTGRGIPVFNTPGANANSVKELVLAGRLTTLSVVSRTDQCAIAQLCRVGSCNSTL